MELETEINDFSSSQRIDSYFSKFFKVEGNKITKPKNSNTFNNICNYNFPNISNNINGNQINFKINLNKYPFKTNDGNMNNNLFISNMNINNNLNTKEQNQSIILFQKVN